MTLEQPHSVAINRKEFRLEHDYIYQWGHLLDEYRIFVPEGFIYDRASVPWIGRAILGIRRDGLIEAGAVVHDFIYENEGRMPEGTWQREVKGKWVDVGTVWTRENADKMFFRIMRDSGMSRWKRRLAYRVVRRFGWVAWR